MNISPETKTISEIFPIDGNQKYVIPIYQRNYSWGSKQIDTLISDINSEKEGYYIGNLLITSNGKKINEIVDGQQRLTTVAIIFIAIYEILNEIQYKNEDETKEIGSIQYDIRRKLLLDRDHERPKYELLEDDHVIFKDLLKIVVDKKPKKWGNRRFGKRFKEIKSILKDYFTDYNSLNYFYRKLNNVEILKITVTNLSDAFSVFSALNSKGLPLTLVDLLKNEYLKNAIKEGRESSIALNDWHDFVGIFAVDQDVDTKSITQFLLNNYDAFEGKTNSSITKSIALDKYTKVLEEKQSYYIKDLINRAKWFMFIKEGKGELLDNEDIGILISEITYLDASQAYPLMLYVFVEFESLQLELNHLSKVLEMIKKFFIIRNVTLRPKSSNIRSMFMGLNRKIRKEALKSLGIVELIKKELIYHSDDIDQFKSELVHEGIYDKSRLTTRFLLIQLERTFGNYFNKAHADTLEDYVSSKTSKKPKLRWTIEHILPQGDNLPDYWIKTLDTNGREPERVQEEYCHKIGNLTLTPYNSEMGQKDFLSKVNQTDNGVQVGLSLPLFLNQSIFGEESIDSKEEWTLDDIDRRSNTLADKLAELVKF
mgnify:CR=1 FL=1